MEKKKIESFENYKNILNKIDIGELMFNSIDYDGTGQGLDINFYINHCKNLETPLDFWRSRKNRTYL